MTDTPCMRSTGPPITHPPVPRRYTMSNTPNTPEAVEPRAFTVVVADLATAQKNRTEALKAIEALPADAKAAEKKSADEALKAVEVVIEGLTAEKRKAARVLVEGQLAEKQAAYNSATTAGVKAALRRDMNK